MPTCPTAQSVVLSAATGSRAPSQSPRTRSLQNHLAEPTRPADVQPNREVAQPSPADGQPSPVDFPPSRVDFPPSRVDFLPSRVDFPPRRVDFLPSRVDSLPSQEGHPREPPNRCPRPVPAQRVVPTDQTPRRRRSWACPPQRGSQQGCWRQRRRQPAHRRDAVSLSTLCSSSWSPQSQ